MRNELLQAAQLLARERGAHRRITLAAKHRPSDLDEAYALQDAIGRKFVPGGVAVRGSKVGAPDAKTQPTVAPIYDVVDSPTQFPAADFNMIGVETEIAVLFGRDLPARSHPYRDEEVFAAVDAICVAIEVCDTRLTDWECADALSKLADHAGKRSPLKAGDVVTTGSWLGMHVVEPGANVLVEFPGLGSAAVRFRR